MSTAATETLGNSIQEMTVQADKGRFELAEARTAVVQIAAEVVEISHEVARGHVTRAPEVPGLLERQRALEQDVARRERELTKLRAELQGAKDKADRAEADELMNRMEENRERVINAVREAALTLGELHEDGKKVAKLIPPVLSAPGRERLLELLRPLDPYFAWIDSKRDVEDIHGIRVRAVTPL